MSEVNCALRKCPCMGNVYRFKNTTTSKQKSICSTINFRIDHGHLLLNLQRKTVFLDTPQGILILLVNFMNLWCCMMLHESTSTRSLGAPQLCLRFPPWGAAGRFPMESRGEHDEVNGELEKIDVVWQRALSNVTRKHQEREGQIMSCSFSDKNWSFALLPFISSSPPIEISL